VIRKVGEGAECRAHLGDLARDGAHAALCPPYGTHSNFKQPLRVVIASEAKQSIHQLAEAWIASSLRSSQ